VIPVFGCGSAGYVENTRHEVGSVQWLVQASVVVRLHQSVNRMPDLVMQIDPPTGRMRPGGGGTSPLGLG
jgi:hypothetical protein